jgi:hypothetical protein
MSTKQADTRPEPKSGQRPCVNTRVSKLGRGLAMAGALAAVSLTAMPTTADAGGSGTGAAIGLGILGGVIAGTAIAAATSPVYAAPPSNYYYPQQGYYYNAPAPIYYIPGQPYYGPAPYGHPPYNYQ